MANNGVITGSFSKSCKSDQQSATQAKIAYPLQVSQIAVEYSGSFSLSSRSSGKHRKAAKRQTCSSMCVAFLSYAYCVNPICVSTNAMR